MLIASPVQDSVIYVVPKDAPGPSYDRSGEMGGMKSELPEGGYGTVFASTGRAFCSGPRLG